MKSWEELSEKERTPEAGYREALRRIEAVSVTRTPYLDLADLQLHKIPGEISRLRLIRELDISYNKINDISPLIGLNNLTHLWLDSNYIKSIYPVISHELELLSIEDNLLTDSEVNRLLEMNSLISLGIGKNNIENYSILGDFAWIKKLSIRNSTVGDIKFVGKLNQLESLNLSSNFVSELSSLSFCDDLKELRLNNNEIHDLEPLKFLKSLSKLYFDRNDIQSVKPLKRLSSMTILSASFNKLSDIRPLSKMKALRSINLGNNEIIDIGVLANLKNLKRINVDNNNISDLSPIVGLKNLIDLRFADNSIKDIEPIRNLHNLNTLDLASNDVSDLNAVKDLDFLKRVNLSNCKKIKSLRPLRTMISRGFSIHYRKTTLKGIIISKEFIEEPPLEIVKQGAKAILRYWEEIDTAAAKQYEGRLLIVGQGQVGKTSLLKKLQDPNCDLDPNESETHGINIWRDWYFPVPDTESDQFRASVWDFGGQDVQHESHQYFITPGTVFVVMINKRNANATEERQQLDYWLRIIAALGRREGEMARVLVVNNVFAETNAAFGVDLAEFAALYEGVLDISLHRVNLKTDAKAVASLREEMETALLALPEVGRKVPEGWAEIREALSQLRDRRRISFDTFAEVCRRHGKEEEASQLLLCRYLNRLGEIIYYEKHGLANEILLDIDWITTAVYGITTNQAIIDAEGAFTEGQVTDIWREKGITSTRDHDLMLRLLQIDAFELCWKVKDNDTYLTPSLFTVKRPAVPKIEAGLGLRLRTGYLPKGLLTQSIVRLHERAVAEQYWRYGVYLIYDQARAVLEHPVGKDYLEIRVEGPSPYNYALLRLIHEEVERVRERSFPRIRFEVEVPCPCERCRGEDWEHQYFSRDLLEKLRRSGERTVTCGNQKQSGIDALLTGMTIMQNLNLNRHDMNFIQEMRTLIGSNRIDEALKLLRQRYPSNQTTALEREWEDHKGKQRMGLLSYEQEALANRRFTARLLDIISSLEAEPDPAKRENIVDAKLDGLQQQLTNIDLTTRNTNQKVTALGTIALHLTKEMDEIKGSLFADRTERKTFERLLVDRIDTLPEAKHPGEEWYDKPIKDKIKIAVPLLPFVKWERELEFSEASVPKSWSAFKAWFVK